MKQSITAVLGVFLLTIGIAKAQSVSDGIKDLNAQKYQSAKATFEKLLAANPNDIEATYWLGQTFLEMDDVASAKNLYEKALVASANAPLVIVGMGQVELIQNKINEARQRFEAAITMTSGKKGNDPVILNAVGHAIAEVYTDKEKKGDINYAVQKLEEASQAKTKDNALLADIYVNLGDAIRKAKPGEGGGPAFTNYKKAAEANPSFALASYRLAQLFNTQRNWELYEQYLNETISKDPKFAPAYYDLSYLKMSKGDLAAAEQYATKYAESADPDPQNDYLRVSLLYAQKKYNDAIAGAKAIMSKLGDKTRARVFRLLAYSYVDKGDTLQAKQYIDEFFTKAKAPDDAIAKDYKLKADIYLTLPGQEDAAFNAILDGVKADTVLENKVQVLKEGAESFRRKSTQQADDSIKATLRVKEGDLLAMLLQVKPKPTINEMFDAGRAYYFGKSYTQSRDLFLAFEEKYPNEVYGYEWALNNSRIIDTVKVDSIAVPDALKLLDFATKDTTKFKKQYISATSFLALYYANTAGDKEKAIEYLKMWQMVDPANRENIQKNIDILSKAGPSQPKTSGKTSVAENSKTGG